MKANSSIHAEGWELAIDNINAGTSEQNTFFRQLDVPEDVDREVWYAVIITDKWGNSNPETYSGINSNAIKVTGGYTSPSRNSASHQ